MQIDKNIPIPNNTTVAKYPFQDMSIGDSLYFEDPKDYVRGSYAAYNYGKRTGKVFRRAKTDLGGRVWRVE